MKKLILGILLCLSAALDAQVMKYYPTQPMLFGRETRFPFTGGFQTPFVQMIDLNLDGKKDMLCFDRVTSKAYTFVDTGSFGADYVYAPEFEKTFSFINSWFLVRDYNKDGKEDVFCGNNGNIDIYKNISMPGSLKFIRSYITLTDTELVNPSIPDLRSNIYVDSYGLPVIDDIDGDGDLDILSLNILSTYFDFYKNVQVEAGLPKDSMAPLRWKACWGSMGVSFFKNDADLGLSCEYIFRHSAAHFGSTICILDEDGDGDMDLLHGDVGYNTLALFKNGRKEFNYFADTIIATDTAFPSYNTPADMSTWPAAAYIDLDKDGRRDLYFGANETKSSGNINVGGWYKNNGTDAKPRFNFVSNNFWGKDLWDIGCESAPAFFDFDRDGDRDLVIGTGWDKRQSKDSSYALYLYRNDGTDTLPNYLLVDTNWLNLLNYHVAPAIPAFGDMNGDGQPDILIGNQSGRLLYFEYGPGGFVYKTDFFDSIDVGLYSAPAIADLDEDGRNDLLIGDLFGTLHFYKANLSAVYPRFSLVTDTFAGIFTNYSTYDSVNGTWYTETEGRAAPTFADLNHDGKLDMVVGSKHGELYVYLDIRSSLNTTALRTDSIWFDGNSQKFGPVSTGKNTIPAIYTLDGDTMPDFLIGNIGGGLGFYGSKKQAPRLYNIGMGSTPSVQSSFLSVYPNPAGTWLNLYISGNILPERYKIISAAGQFVREGTVRGHQTLLDISSLPPGFYVVLVEGLVSGNVKFLKSE